MVSMKEAFSEALENFLAASPEQSSLEGVSYVCLHQGGTWAFTQKKTHCLEASWGAGDYFTPHGVCLSLSFPLQKEVLRQELAVFFPEMDKQEEVEQYWNEAGDR